MLRDGDLLVLLALSKSGHALLVGVVHHLSQVVAFQSVEYVEEVVTRRSFADGIFFREVRLENWVLLEHRVDPAHGQLVVVRHLDVLHLRLLQQLLLALQDLLEPVLVAHALVGQVVL